MRVRIGSPIKGYGQESRNRAARQRIPNRVFTDEDGVEHVEVIHCVNLFCSWPYIFNYRNKGERRKLGKQKRVLSGNIMKTEHASGKLLHPWASRSGESVHGDV